MTKHPAASITAGLFLLTASAQAQEPYATGQVLTAPAPAQVQTQALVATTPGMGGILAQSSGGLGLDLWRGTNAAHVIQLLGNTKSTSLSPVGRSLLRRLLLSESNPPAGASDDFLELQLSALTELGNLPDVAALSARALHGDSKLPLAQIMLSAHLMDGGLDTACPAQSALSATQKPGVRWARLDAVCHEREGRTLQAELSLELGADASEPDPLFDVLYLALNNKDTNLVLPAGAAKAHPFSTALHLALIREAGLDPALAGMTIEDNSAMGTIARSSGAPLERRIAAAEKAVHFGLMKPSELGDLYSATQMGLNVRSQSTAEASTEIQTAAVHYHNVQNAQPGRDKAAAIATALAAGQARGQFATTAYLYEEALLGLDAGAANQIDTTIIARALLTIGAFADAKPWFMRTYQAARDRAPGSFEALGTIWPLIAMGDEAAAPRGIQRLAAGWLTALNVDGDEAKRRQAVLLFTLLEGYARPVDEPLWGQLLPPAPAEEITSEAHLVDHTLWRGMEAAASRGERGLALSLLLRGLSEAPLQEHHPAYIASCVGVLTALGLEADGHKLAVEALIATGF